ncbi:PPC domain-containing protein [Oscillatoria sp. FACHB-1407]|uniref:PPC domain-containing protein n=1 Tax=Oscillatoria sp. FACHB-1407 TaxID=2692847 RepID=UPI0016824713|nr:PPC domain-containing protein [Oscillatoria sp. FACHB-1407]MBD2462147.1 PPC domain-containing protein [Oscillatoria sp. FACHB-1407]
MTDNSLRQARSLGTLSNRAIARRDVVNLRDRTDFYKFTLNRSSNVQFQLSGLQANADLLLLNGAGRVLGRSRKGGTQTEQVNRQLATGTYYVQVLNRSSGTRYRLLGSATASGGSTTPAGTRANPIDLGILTGGPVTRIQDVATGAGLNDATYYKFQVGQISDVSIALSQISGGGTMFLEYDSNRNGLSDVNDALLEAGGGTESNNDPIVSKPLPANTTYFLSVSRNTLFNTMRYNLTVTTNPAPGNIPTDPGSEPTTAYDLGTLNRGGRFELKDYVGSVDFTDLYRFSLNETTSVTLNKVDVVGGSNLNVFQDRNNNNILEDSEAVFISGVRTLQAGTYYVRLSAGDGAYTVTITT